MFQQGHPVFAMMFWKTAVEALPEIDMVTTPTGKPVAMVHSNNCKSDLKPGWTCSRNSRRCWCGCERIELYEMLYKTGLAGDATQADSLSTTIFSASTLRNLEKGVRFLSVLLKAIYACELYARATCLVAWRSKDRFDPS